jgi:hypothetical protein
MAKQHANFSNDSYVDVYGAVANVDGLSKHLWPAVPPAYCHVDDREMS